jgi:hypothetical protein
MILEPHKYESKIPNQIELVDIKQKELTKVGSRRIRRGHTLFKLDLNVMEITVAPVHRKVVIELDGKPKKIQDLYMEPGCIYESALNVKNVVKKFDKIILKLMRNRK